jgi:hypothetical protein
VMDAIDPKKLSLPRGYRANPPSQKPPRHKAGEYFLRGPIPWKWLAQAARLPGKALHVANVVWFLAGIKSGRTVALSGSVLGDLGVDRYAKYRGLEALEKAGLVSVSRHVGRNPVVTILDLGGAIPQHEEDGLGHGDLLPEV